MSAAPKADGDRLDSKDRGHGERRTAPRLRARAPHLLSLIAVSVVKPPPTATLDTHALVLLMERIKVLNASLTRGGEVLKLKCLCGAVILSPTPAVPGLEDRQRGLLKSKIQHHLRDRHALAEHRIRDILRESFTSP